jgi:hypothetical protein
VTIKPVLRVAFGFAPMATSVDWTDISQWVDLPSKIRCSRGASDELSQCQPGTLSLTLDNSDGRFSAGLASSPYYPYVRPNCPVQLGVVTVSGKNRLQSPTFEDGTVGAWGVKAGSPTLAAWASDVTRAHSGTRSLKVTWTPSGTGGVLEQVVYGLDIGTTYTFSGWVWVPAGDISVRLRVDDLTLGTPSSVTATWQQITRTFTATSTSARLQFTASGTPAAGDVVWLDDVQLETGASATSFDSDGAQIHWRFYGLVNDWGTGWAGLHSKVRLTATDFFKPLSKQPQLTSMLGEEIKLAAPIMHYPLTEPSTSVSAGDVAGYGAGSLIQRQVGTGGEVAFGNAPGPAATGESVLTFTPASASDGIRLDADMGTYAEEQTSLESITVEAWFKTSTVGRYFLAARNADFQRELVLGLNGSGHLILERTMFGGTRTVDTLAAVNMADGEWHHVLFDEWTQNAYVDGGAPVGTSPLVMYALRYLSIGGYPASLWAGSVAHAVLYVDNDVPLVLAEHYTAGTTGFSGEDADARVLRLAGYAGIASVDASGDFSPVGSQGPGGSSALEMMRVVEATEGGRLAAHRDGHALLLQSRTVRYNPIPVASLAYGELETDSVQLPTDDQKLINDYRAARPGGATQRVTDDASIAAFGTYPARPDAIVLKIDDADVVDTMRWAVSRYSIPQPELRELPIQAYAQSTATYRALLDADISTVLEVTSMPAEAPSSTVTATVEGYVEDIGEESHLIRFHTSRSQTDAVWALDSSTYSVLGSTTRLGY